MKGLAVCLCVVCSRDACEHLLVLLFDACGKKAASSKHCKHFASATGLCGEDTKLGGSTPLARRLIRDHCVYVGVMHLSVTPLAAFGLPGRAKSGGLCLPPPFSPSHLPASSSSHQL